MKKMKAHKLLLSVIGLVAICLSLSVTTVLHLVHEQKLDEVQNEALAELERNAGEYDEQSIVLQATSKARAEELAEQFDAVLRITDDGRYAKLTLPEGVTIRDVYAKDENRQYIEEMSADYRVRVSDLAEPEENGECLPTRPQYSVTDADYAQQTYLDYLNMSTVWNNYTGYGITVAVIDTGIDTDHPEFAGKISEYSYNATEDKIVKDWKDAQGNPDWSLIEDEQGHGTAVTGVIAANMNSGNVVGIAPNVTILTIKAECDEYGNFARASDLVFGLYYAIERDVQVVNMSFGTYGLNPFAEATQLAYDSDIICVAAAGNEATTALCYPAADENVIGVGALGDGWELADYSNYGENSDLVAPGSTYTTLMGGRYGTMNGTSLASPIVTGAIALFLQNNPYVTFDDVTEVLYASCYDLGDLGNDWDYGYGALDLSALLSEERGTVTFDMLSDELENTDALFIRGHALQELPEPERLYAVFEGWYYDDTFTQAVEYYTDAFQGDLTLYAKWVNEEDGVPYTYVILDDGTVEIRSYTGHRRYITIPEKIEGRIVSSIGDFAFSGQERLREVGLPSGLTKIGSYAFENCANLVSIEIPEGVKTIGEYAFQNNTRLSTVAFLGNSKLTTIGDFAFAACGSLEKIELPASVTSVNGSAFYGATALHTIHVQKGNTAFTSNDGVLFNLTGSTLVAYPAAYGTSYALPEQTTTIADYAFAYAKLYAVNLANVVSMGSSAFENAALKEVVIPDSVTKMGGSAFRNNYNLSSVTIGKGITEISRKAFENCFALTEIVIPSGIQSIGAQSFAASGLETVTFEEGSVLTGIGENAFFDCKIREIDIPASVVAIGGNAFSGCMIGNPLIRVGFAENSELRTIGESAFAKCWLLETIDLPAKLESIGEKAFMESGLTTVTIPASVTDLGAGAFAACTALPAIEVEEGNTVYHDIDGVVYNLANTEIYAYPSGREAYDYTLESTTVTVMPWAFAGAAYPGTVQLPESLVQISEYAFYLCTNLQTVHIPDNVTQIGRCAFAEDWNLYSVTFNETSKLPRISYGAFAYSGLNYFTVPANVSTMAQRAFEGCYKLTSITFAENSKLESISAYLFDGCTNLQSITFLPGSALTSVQAHGLEGMDKLTSINFGDAKVTNIDNFAFRFCESLSTINLPSTVTNIGRYAFYGCKSLSELAIPEPVEHIGSYAFLGTNALDLYFASDVLPAYLDENWDHGTRGYYVGVTEVTTSGDFKYATLTSGDVAIIEYLGTDAYVDLSKLNFGAPITAIGGSAFKDSTVTSIVLPDTLTSIQAEAFQYTELESITIPANVTFIGREAFAHTWIKSLTFAEGSKLTVMEQYAFEGTENLASVTLPASLTTMGTGAFLESGLTSVTFAKGIKLSEIPQRAFAETKLTKVALPDSVTLVNHNAFNNVQTLTTVTFGNNDGIRLMSNAFYHTGLTSLNIPANVTYIGEYCFVALPNLTSFSVDANNPNYTAVDGLLLSKDGRKLIAVPAGRTGSLTVPKSVEEIGFGAFEESKLSEILFHADANILTFGYRAFFKAENITTISIPKSVVSIDYYAFAYCKNLQTVTFAEGNQLKGIYEGAFLGDINLVNITIPDSIVEISDFAFYGCSKIDELPISENNAIKGIYDYAFAYTGLKGEFTTPETLVDIGNYAFLGTKLTKVTIPDTNKKILVIGIGAFEDCNKLEEMTLPFIGASYEDDELSWFGYIFGAGAYSANGTYVPESLKTVTIAEGITNIYIGGFAYCTGLETINVPHSVSVLWNDAFMDTTAKYELTNTIMTYWVDGWGNVYPETRESHFGKGISGALVVADEVTTIYDWAFGNCTSLESITIPDSVTLIGWAVFNSCSRLESVIIGDSVTLIDEAAFINCSSLTSIEIPDSVTSIGGRAFYGCSSLTSVVIGDSVTSIGDSAFYNCSSLTSVVIPDSVTTIGNWAFSGCTSLASITLPDSVIMIGTCAFYNCTSLASITLPDSVTTIGDYAFEECTSLVSITLPDSVTSIGDYAFQDCSSLTSVVIGDSVTSIGDSAFYNCSSLTSVVIGDSVTSIGDTAFRDCSSLTSVVIGDSVTSIGVWAFYNCSNLTSVVIPNGVTSIANGAFYNCSSLTSIVIPDSVISIGGSAVRGCSSLTSVVIGNSVTSIGDYAFYNCSSLASVVIPDSVTSIDDFAFDNCSSLTSVVIPDSVTTIGDYAFSGCSSLTSVVIPDSVTWIGDSAFSGCSSLTSVAIPDSVTMIGRSVFSGCSSVTSITIPNSVTSIGDSAFSYCSSLMSVVIPDSVTSIGGSAFRDCSSLTSIVIGNSVTSILANAFRNCTMLYQVQNNSSIALTIGRTDYGYVAYYAKVIIDKDGNKVSGNGEFEYIDTAEGFRFIKEKGTYTLIAYLGSEDTITLPDSINGYFYTISYFRGGKKVIIPDSVTTIGNYAFYNCSSLTSVVIPDSVTSIGDDAFRYCSSLTSVVIPDGVTSIGKDAFYYCDKLASVTIGNGVTTIGDYAFCGCKSLSSVVIGDSVISIGKSAFAGCNSLKNMTIPSSVNSIGVYAFDGCSNVTIAENNLHYKMIDGILYDRAVTSIIYVSSDVSGDIVLPNGLVSIGGYVFQNCSGVTSVTIPDSVMTIEKYAFEGCTGLISVTIPDSVTMIDAAAFMNCTSLTSIKFPDSLTTIGDYAFSDCSSLTSVTIPDSVITIDDAFFNCSSLTSVEIGSSVTTIGDYTFFGCSSLTKFIVSEDNTAYCAYDGILYDKSVTKFVWIPKNLSGDIVIPDGVTSIAGSTFTGCSSLTSITIPDSVTTIGDSAFSYCSSLTSVVIPDSVTKIGRSGFSDCSSLTSIVIPGSVTTIGNSAFSGCSSLTSVVIGDSVTSIGDWAFSYCSSLTSVVIPDSVTKIGRSGFSDCSSLTSIVIPDSVTSIGDYAFQYCSSLTSVVISEGVTTIGQYMFNNCSSLTSIEIPNSVTWISSYAFQDCSSLTSIEIPDGVTWIGSYAFRYCSSLMSIEIPNSVTSIGDYAFDNCSSLASVVIPDSVTWIGSYVFRYCSSLTSVVIPDSVTLIGDYAFQYCSSLTSVAIPDSVTTIGKSVFSSCSGLTSITIPDSVTSIGDSVFSSCRSLKSVAIPDSVTTIGNSAFYNCSSLTSIEIPDSVTSIGDSAFSYCSSLTSVVIPDSVTSIGDSAFEFCRNLIDVVIGDSVTSIGSSAFYGCSSLYYVQNNSSITLTIGSTDNGCVAYSAKVITDKNGNKTYLDTDSVIEYIDTADGFLFVKENNMYQLIAYLGTENTIILPETINGNAYQIYCFRGGKNVIIPDSVTSIGNYAFYNCGSLTSIEIPDSVTSIGGSAFSYCSSLTSVVIPDSVTSIGDYAFSDCSSLTSIVIGDSVTSIGNFVFKGCAGLKSVTIPDSVTFIGENAYYDCTALYENPAYYSNGMLVIDGWLLDVSENLEYLTNIENIREVSRGAYDNCHLLKNAVWAPNVTLSSNVETLYITDINAMTPYLQNTLTLKNVVIMDSVGLSDLRNCEALFTWYNFTGVTIFVEFAEEDLRWDDNFPGWNNGNRVIYGDEWSWTTFRDGDGNVISVEPRLNSQVIVRPVVDTKYDGEYAYVFAGWDIDGDGIVDNVPAISVVDINAQAVMEKVARTHTVEFVGTSGTAYRSEELAYGAAINALADPTRKGYTFLGWSGYVSGMTADADYVFTAEWQHIGGGHKWSESKVVEPTCTEQGYTHTVCAVCDEEERSDYKPSLGHAWGAIKVFRAATCTEDGVGTSTCSTCGESQTVVISAKGHDFSVTVQAEATCSIGGELLYTCDDCGVEIIETSPTVAHQYEKAYTSKAWLEWLTEQQLNVFYGYEGSELYYYQCVNCDRIQTAEENAAGGSTSAMGTCNHNPSEWKIVYTGSGEGTGIEGQRCTICGKLLSVRVCSEAFGRITVTAKGSINYAVSGSVVTVTHDTACKAGYLVGDSYVAINAVANRDGSYSFTAPEEVTEVLLVVIGDVDQDGNLDSDDTDALGAALQPGAAKLSAEAKFAADVNENGKLNSADLILIGRSILDTSNTLYKAFEW